jgi:hypothetical protein
VVRALHKPQEKAKKMARCIGKRKERQTPTLKKAQPNRGLSRLSDGWAWTSRNSFAEKLVPKLYYKFLIRC